MNQKPNGCNMNSSSQNDTDKTERKAAKSSPGGKRSRKPARSTKPLVIVESRAKARTVARYLGRNYIVKACLGHVRDLPKTSLGIDLEHDFKPNYVTNRERKDIVNDIKKSAKSATQIIIATDPDREGEAIAWHLNHILKKPDITRRIEFHEITKPAVREAIAHPRDIDINRVNAQQARRILDRLVGYNLSPFLWRELASGLSAGRVQSVVTKLICEREEEIEAFVPQEYWTIDGIFRKVEDESEPPAKFTAGLVRIDGASVEIGNAEDAGKIVDELAQQDFKVDSVSTRTIQKRPLPPFITSTLQQEASKRLGFSARKTMNIAQQLYEGIDVGEGGEEGLITYMRTDSIRLADEAIGLARDFIRETFGPDYLPGSPNIYKSKRKVQDAHEAIRPTAPSRTPDSIKRYLEDDQAKLYGLIWERFIACQMTPGRDEQTQVEITGGRFTFRATRTRRVFDGYRKVYSAGNNNGQNQEPLPPLTENQPLVAEEFLPEQHFTKPPPRYTTASLIKTLEEKGIGRPSTYAPTISTILDRKYVTREGQSFKPTDLGRKVNALLLDKFADIINEGFTARMENNLDAIQSGEKDWVASVREFYEPFLEDLRNALDMKCPKCGAPIAIRNGRYGAFFACTRYPECDWRSSISPKSQDTEPEKIDEKCPLCGKNLIIKHGRYGRFIACTGFPECRYTRSIPEEHEKSEKADSPQAPGQKREVTYSEEPCPKCGARMVLRRSRTGRFWGCEKYPECDGIRPYTIGVKCTREGCDGEFVERRTRRGKIFYGCSNYPDCTEISWTYPGRREESEAKPESEKEPVSETQD